VDFARWYAGAVGTLSWPAREWSRDLPGEVPEERYELDERGQLWLVLALGEHAIIRLCVPAAHWRWAAHVRG